MACPLKICIGKLGMKSNFLQLHAQKMIYVNRLTKNVCAVKSVMSREAKGTNYTRRTTEYLA